MLLPWVGALCLSCCADVNGSLSRAVRPLKLGHQAGGEEQGRALLHGIWASMGSDGFLGQVSRERPSEIPEKGRHRFLEFLQVSCVLSTTLGSGGGSCEPLGQPLQRRRS